MRSLVVLLLVCVAASQAQLTLPQLDFNALLDPLKTSVTAAVQEAATNFLKQLQEALGSLGKRDLEVKAQFQQVKQVVEKVKDLVSQKLREIFSQFAQKLQELYPKLLTGKGEREVTYAVADINAALKAMLEEALGHFKNLAAQVASSTLGKVVEVINPQGGKRDVLKGFNDALKQLVQVLQGHVSNVGQTLVDHGKQVVENLKPHLDNLKDQLVGHGLNAAQSVLEALAAAAASAGKRDVLKQANDAVQKLLDQLRGQAKNLGQTLNDHGKQVVDSLIPHVENLKEQLVAHGLNAVQSVLDALAAAASSVGKRDVNDQLKGFFDEALGHLKNILAQIASSTIGKVADTINPQGKRDVLKQANDAVQKLLEQLRGQAKNLGQTLNDHGKQVVDNLIPHVENLKEQLVAHGLNAVQSVLDALAAAAASVGK